MVAAMHIAICAIDLALGVAYAVMAVEKDNGLGWPFLVRSTICFAVAVLVFWRLMDV